MVRKGAATVAERRQLLAEHRATVAAAKVELGEALDVLDRKIAYHTATEAGLDVDCGTRPLRHVPELP